MPGSSSVRTRRQQAAGDSPICSASCWLLRLYEEGADIDRAILALSTYVGHAKVSNTYWYVTGIPELMAIAAGRFHLYTQGGTS
jgi:hypothetical protein